MTMRTPGAVSAAYSVAIMKMFLFFISFGPTGSAPYFKLPVTADS
jgi:hypothetical protein